MGFHYILNPPRTIMGYFSCFFFSTPAEFFQNYYFQKFFQGHYQNVKQFGSRSGPTSGPKVMKLFSYSTQLSTKLILLINVKMPTKKMLAF